MPPNLLYANEDVLGPSTSPAPFPDRDCIKQEILPAQIREFKVMEQVVDGLVCCAYDVLIITGV